MTTWTPIDSTQVPAWSEIDVMHGDAAFQTDAFQDDAFQMSMWTTIDSAQIAGWAEIITV
jgi:hypothetical protein